MMFHLNKGHSLLSSIKVHDGDLLKSNFFFEVGEGNQIDRCAPNIYSCISENCSDCPAVEEVKQMMRQATEGENLLLYVFKILRTR